MTATRQLRRAYLYGGAELDPLPMRIAVNGFADGAHPPNQTEDFGNGRQTKESHDDILLRPTRRELYATLSVTHYRALWGT
jgi:hypothetical protein